MEAYSNGCKLCQIGAKMVLFVTGVCARSCFYCPLSGHRKGQDAVYANERQVNCDADLIDETRSMDALGTGVTGGEPLLVLARVCHYLALLKYEFGAEHHIHLYTSLPPSVNTLRALARSGLDEIRLHPSLEEWDAFATSRYRGALKYAKTLGMEVGVEIPAIKPVPAILSVLQEVSGFLNLNELEFSETNYDAMTNAGFVPLTSGYAAAGSREMAKRIADGEVPTYFCSSASKDRVQLRERFKRKARRLARPFDEVTEDGTLVFGVVESMQRDDYPADISDEDYMVVNGDMFTSWQLTFALAKNHPELAKKARVVEMLPDGTVIEVTPLSSCLKPKT
ncbi:MAG TPA: radical SAM protein [Candidatus Bathyarchaeia archaeon]|nr:radical SAM protein [Candidatus Bathyarchaeia archaeon]